MKLKNKNAISLIVLVITILVLSILAATVIISISGTNVIGEVNKTVFKSDLSNYKEAFELYVTNETVKDSSFDRTTLDGTYKTNKDTFKEIFGEVSEKYQDGLEIQDGKLIYDTEDETEKAIADSLGMTIVVTLVTYTSEGVPIPSNFYVVGGTKTSGLVISDNAADENKGVDYTCDGNQFVWVPVDDYSKFVRGSAELDSKTNTYKMTGTLDTSYTEPYTSGYSTEQAEYNAMCASVQEYGGFYIARFEAGDGSTRVARTAATDAHTVVSKKGAFVYNYVPWGKKLNDIGTTGAVYLSQNMYKDHESVVSTLCYGVQWDAVMNFVSDAEHNITDSRSWGNYSDSIDPAVANSGSSNMNYTTGRSEAWKAKNIYDLAGNVWEWTVETYSSARRVRRGGNYVISGSGSGYPASFRDSDYPGYSSLSIGFRPALYIWVAE